MCARSLYDDEGELGAECGAVWPRMPATVPLRARGLECLQDRCLCFEEQLVLQSRVRINAGLTLLALGVYTQLALVLKKKQFEHLGCYGVVSPRRTMPVFWAKGDGCTESMLGFSPRGLRLAVCMPSCTSPILGFNWAAKVLMHSGTWAP